MRRSPITRILCLVAAVSLPAAVLAAREPGNTGSGKPFHQAELLFPLDPLHNHASCVVECPNGDLLVSWYRGSGERTADDVRVLGARLRRGASRWSEPFVMADVPGFPDCNPAMVIDPARRLWLFWPVIQANEWHTALLMYKVSSRYQRDGPPVWSQEKVLFLKPGPEFMRLVSESVDRDLQRLDSFPAARRDRVRTYLEDRRKHGADKYFNRLGWMPRAHAFILDRQRFIVPLYSDGFDFSLMAITDDWGEHWSASLPLVSDGGVQPSIVKKADGTLATFMRDNGGPPNRLMYSESRDRGQSWSPVRDTSLPNPGSGAEVVGLREGHWALIYNDTERGRHSLAISLSEDEGKTWRWTRHLELDRSSEGAGSYSYPSLIQAADGSLHATYSFSARASDVKRDPQGRALRQSIKHAHFSEAWVQAGDL